ncbi:glutamine synthetase family protein [Aquimarina agarivorans]|uniref:glutamine synthetase family protein n=1 Tax=Aquimarina agarivorans TaxID=980584 RepID=UPI000248EBF3|nr:glutamine synthetase [Aquimarina agarivorans]
MSFKKIMFTDIDGVSRGKYISENKFKKNNSLGFCDVVFGWDLHDECYSQDSLTGWEKGFPDAIFTIDEKSKRTVNEANCDALYFGDFSTDENFKNVCPRSLLKSILKAYESLNLVPKIGFEYEWFNFKKDVENLEGVTSGMFGYSLNRLSENQAYIDEILKVTKSFDVSTEGLHTETGPGVYEAALSYTDALKACDDATLFKSIVKTTAKKFDFLASFMAKWNAELPGCGGHIHISIENKQGQNILNFSNNNNLDATTSNFLAGVLNASPAMLPIYAPTINSYKRLQPDSWAPTTVSWGYQNRTTAIRVISESYVNDHIEMRIPGADTNPYLIVYAVLASGLHGIKEKLDLKIKNQVGNAYKNTTLDKLSNNLNDAITVMEYHPLTAQLLNPVFSEHFIKTRKWEVEKFNKSVSNWEVNRYLEII